MTTAAPGPPEEPGPARRPRRPASPAPRLRLVVLLPALALIPLALFAVSRARSGPPPLPPYFAERDAVQKTVKERMAAKDWEGALAPLARLIELEAPVPFWGHHQRGVVYIHLERWAEAKADLDISLEIHDENVAALIDRQLVHGELGDWPAALRDAERALALTPTSATAHENRSYARSRCGDLRGALADTTRALELDPTLRTALSSRPLLLAQLGEWAAVPAACDAALPAAPPELQDALAKLRARAEAEPGR